MHDCLTRRECGRKQATAQRVRFGWIKSVNVRGTRKSLSCFGENLATVSFLL